ncbi:MAG: hypothetical protein Ct9H300mP11_10730 [Chloroflexota bacterium]|nr:MAG: hypothetical protein Ct9H300mP11_10730 [Chloroflexota bacterium]
MGAIRPRPERRSSWGGFSRLLRSEKFSRRIETYRPVFEARQDAFRRQGMPQVFHSLEDAIERSSALVGSPQQIIDKVLRYHEQMGHEVLALNSDGVGLTSLQHRATLELFQSDIAPVLRRQIPSRAF